MRRWFIFGAPLVLTMLTALALSAQEPKDKPGDRPEAGGRKGREEPRPGDERPKINFKGGPRGKADDRGPMPGPGGRSGGFGPGGPFPPGGEPGRGPGFQEAERTFRHFDRNDDGKLDADEWRQFPGGGDDFDQVDANKDGSITIEEQVAHWQRGGRGGMRGGFGGGFEGGGGFGGGRGGGFGMGGFAFGGFGGPGGPAPPDDPEMRELMKQDADLDRQAMEMSNQVRRASSDEREKLKSQLAEVVNKHFDVRQKRRDLQLKRLQEELERLQSAISKRNASREAIVKNRLAELLGEPRDLEF